MTINSSLELKFIKYESCKLIDIFKKKNILVRKKFSIELSEILNFVILNELLEITSPMYFQELLFYTTLVRQSFNDITSLKYNNFFEEKKNFLLHDLILFFSNKIFLYNNNISFTNHNVRCCLISTSLNESIGNLNNSKKTIEYCEKNIMSSRNIEMEIYLTRLFIDLKNYFRTCFYLNKIFMIKESWSNITIFSKIAITEYLILLYILEKNFFQISKMYFFIYINFLNNPINEGINTSELDISKIFLDFCELPSPRLFKLVKLHFNLKNIPNKLLYRTSYLTKKSLLLTWNSFKKYTEEINTNYLFTRLSLRSLKILFKSNLIGKLFWKLKRNKMLLKFVNLSKLIGIDLIDFYHWLFYMNELNIYFNYDTKNFLIYVL